MKYSCERSQKYNVKLKTTIMKLLVFSIAIILTTSMLFCGCWPCVPDATSPRWKQ